MKIFMFQAEKPNAGWLFLAWLSKHKSNCINEGNIETQFVRCIDTVLLDFLLFAKFYFCQFIGDAVQNYEIFTLHS